MLDKLVLDSKRSALCIWSYLKCIHVYANEIS